KCKGQYKGKALPFQQKIPNVLFKDLGTGRGSTAAYPRCVPLAQDFTGVIDPKIAGGPELWAIER
ncbi:MAG: hypothetical protein AAF330_07215, partial [Pseudomonadota bacterium]